MGANPQTSEETLASLKAKLLRVFPKSTPPGCGFSYAPFSTSPPAATTGVVHVCQLCAFLEPLFGASWEAVRTEVGYLVSGGVGKTIQVSSVVGSRPSLTCSSFG